MVNNPLIHVTVYICGGGVALGEYTVGIPMTWHGETSQQQLRNLMNGSQQENVDPEVLRKAVKHLVKFSEIKDARCLRNFGALSFGWLCLLHSSPLKLSRGCRGSS